MLVFPVIVSLYCINSVGLSLEILTQLQPLIINEKKMKFELYHPIMSKYKSQEFFAQHRKDSNLFNYKLDSQLEQTTRRSPSRYY